MMEYLNDHTIGMAILDSVTLRPSTVVINCYDE